MALGGACARPLAPRAPAPISAPAAVPPSPPWMKRVELEVETLRGRAFRGSVPYERQSREGYRAKVRDELRHDLGPQKAADESRVLSALGLVPAGFDLRRAMEEILVSQVAAYYDTKTRDFHVIESTQKEDADEALGVVAHELTHALQDQHFGLEAFEGEHPFDLGLDDDEKLARRCVVEGDATFIMFARALATGQGAAIHLGPLTVAGLRLTFAMTAAADPLSLMSLARQGRKLEELDAETREQLETLERLPPVVTLPLIEPYFKGGELVSEVWGRGGWPAVDALYRAPPESTEQVLHPLTKLLDARDPPVHVRLLATPLPLSPDPRGTRLLETNVLGELGWRVYFKTWKLASSDRAAEDWGGDRYWVWQRGARLVAAVATTWDTEAAAAAFADAYEATLAARFPRATVGSAAGALAMHGPDGRDIVVERRGHDVDVIDGASTDELVTLRAALRAAERRPAHGEEAAP